MMDHPAVREDGMMNAHFWHAVLSVPDDEEAKRMLDMLEVYEWRQERAERERQIEAVLTKLRQATLP